ncbi:hypothetical protein ASPWEDRAFT_175294 [Aspergillus wentii DTO 134E9]|uniref:Nitroreductase domain-containing protein n=1 Tax=Aspergillus wentii DTO 134E9 TaxID=1073089 RepID=A0A1L9RAT0_ASPWE|nr:uncharacterized protein ASPWEDRAFT_175294 [Aspergillus wentii DTO 134E9]KAI9934567.1 hypothetical protein MW887_000182 [Aspergillus wentii]OJJ31983.1 hypothetical protein ASPWEDRAFT_175294 [Aspergillus wentii DTO 134E9]
MPDSTGVLNALTNRRSHYGLTSKSPIPDTKIQSIIATILHRTPSAFNSQSTRIVVLLKHEHIKFWDVVKGVLYERLTGERFAHYAPKLDSFQAGYGTVLFYEDMPTINFMKGTFPTYAEHFDDWSEHTSGMHQLMVWMALEAEGFGANLQHYHPVVDERVAESFRIPGEWRLRAQLVFGMPGEGVELPVKEKKGIHETLRVVGGDL